MVVIAIGAIINVSRKGCVSTKYCRLTALATTQDRYVYFSSPEKDATMEGTKVLSIA